MQQRVAIVTGVGGQDGSYLSDLLLEMGYKVYGLLRRSSSNGLGCSKHLEGVRDFEPCEGDVTDLKSLTDLCVRARAHEFYNLAAQSHVATSFSQPHLTMEVTGHGALNCLEAIKSSGYHTRFYQASTSEMFGGVAPPDAGYDESSPFHPRSPYGTSKLFAHWTTINYRESYNMYACCGILFNHESPRRGPNFVTRKITQYIAKLKMGQVSSPLALGNLDAMRDWGYAPDYVKGMWHMLQRPVPEEYVLCTGKTVSVRQFCELAFSEIGEDYSKHVIVDPRFYRPAEVYTLRGNPSKACRELGWSNEHSLKVLAQTMVASDIALLSKGA